MEPIAIGVELGFDELFVDRDCVAFSSKLDRHLFGLFPSGALHLEAFDVGSKVSVVKQGMTKLVEEEGIKIRRIFDVADGARGAKRELFAGLKM